MESVSCCKTPFVLENVSRMLDSRDNAQEGLNITFNDIKTKSPIPRPQPLEARGLATYELPVDESQSPFPLSGAYVNHLS